MKSCKLTRATALLALIVFFASAASMPLTVTRADSPAAQQSIQLPQGVERVTSVEGITEYKLANGLRVLLFPDQSKPTITVNITYMVGSRHENYGETGMAHLLEHLVFKGTPKHPDIPKELTEHGARPNGTTSYDRTNYFETFQATDENLNWALDLESDRMVNSFIARKDLDSEMTVVRNEFERGENSPIGALLKTMTSTAFMWHNYGKTTIGARSDIENVNIERLQAFYRKYYQPDNAILLVAGKIDEGKTLQLVHKYFSPIPRPSRVIEKTYTSEPVQDGERLVTVRRVGDVQYACALYKIPAGAHPDFAALDIMTDILTDSPSGRLHKSLVETKKSSNIFGFNFQLREPGMAMFFAEVRQESSLDAARDTLIETIESLAKNAPTKEEVERARTAQLKNIELTLNDPNRVGLELSEWMAMGDWRLFFLHRDRLRKVTPEDVQRVAASYLKAANRTVGQFMPTAKPERAEIPDTPDVAAMLKDYKGDAAVASGEAFDASPANIEARVVRADAPSGIKFALLPKKTRGNTVQATLTFRFGDEQSLQNRGTAAEMAGQMLMRGTSKKTREQIKDEFDKLKARVFVFGGASQATASIETTRENLPAVLKLVAEVLRDPSFPEKEFELLKEDTLASIEQQRSEPQAIAFTALQRHMNPYPKSDPRYVATVEEEIEDVKKVTLAEVKQFYKEFYGGSFGEFAAVGDFDDKEISKLVTDLFADWKTPRQYSRLVSTFKDIPSLVKSFETPDKTNAVFVASQNLNLRDDDPDYPALVLGNYMLGGGFLSSRLATRLRQKEGLSYTVTSGLSASSLDKSGSFFAFAIYAPQNVSKLEAAFREEIDRVLKEGYTEAEVTAAKSGYLQSQQVNRAQDAGLARRLSSYRFLNRTMQWDAEFEKKIAALTVDQINAAMRKYLDASKFSIMKAGDFAKAAAAEKK